VDNLIKLKKLQVVNGALKKIDERFFFFKIFFKEFFLGEEGRMGYFHPFSKKVFFKELG